MENLLDDSNWISRYRFLQIFDYISSKRNKYVQQVRASSYLNMINRTRLYSWINPQTYNCHMNRNFRNSLQIPPRGFLAISIFFRHGTEYLKETPAI